MRPVGIGPNEINGRINECLINNLGLPDSFDLVSYQGNHAFNTTMLNHQWSFGLHPRSSFMVFGFYYNILKYLKSDERRLLGCTLTFQLLRPYPSPAESDVEICERIEEIFMRLSQRQLRIEETALRIENLDVACIAVSIAKPSKVRGFSQSIGLLGQHLDLLYCFLMIDERILRLTKTIPNC